MSEQCDHDWQGVAPGPERCTKCGTSRPYYHPETAHSPICNAFWNGMYCEKSDGHEGPHEFVEDFL